MELVNYILFFLLILIAVLCYFVYTSLLYKKLFQNCLFGISLIKNEKVIDCNPTLLALFGYTNKKDFLNIHPLVLSPAYQPDGEFSITKANQVFGKAKIDGNSTFDWVFLDINGTEKLIEITIFKMEYFRSELYFMMWKNINQRKQIENDLKELNLNLEHLVEIKTKKLNEQDHMLFIQSKQAQMGEMISMIAHQWRQPLAAIAATVIDLKMKIHFGKLRDKPMDMNEFVSYTDDQLNDIENYTQVLTRIIDDFRNFYKPQNQQVANVVNETILKSFNIVKSSLESSGVKVVMNFDSKTIIEHYEGEIIHVMLNLFNNSMENFHENGTKERLINIGTSDTEKGVVMNFCDNGGGIRNENLDKIFSPYFTTKQKGLGTGLGLYMSKKIFTEHHNGDIKAINNKNGVCFEMEINR